MTTIVVADRVERAKRLGAELGLQGRVHPVNIRDVHSSHACRGMTADLIIVDDTVVLDERAREHLNYTVIGSEDGRILTASEYRSAEGRPQGQHD
ncbi:hypothetical protein SEA_PHAYONCE_75 [Mycobacterium phage Phayonce]|uniref:Uncharacterized protein n=1 Tax=Mycobacterium phage Phayonce TaxID=1647302 RepID=A0A0F6WDY5_9CAUD|nr:hypothetical protein SEA_PHAYONCE_75 [Mycobacterium phage Phayonce]AKF14435.1 hypothetical protein SEA_PHAYONCE_75 [Mycobacterium phage Phayonce]